LIEKTNRAWINLSRDWHDVEPADFRRATNRMNASLQLPAMEKQPQILRLRLAGEPAKLRSG
jgi:hypothetical protein